MTRGNFDVALFARTTVTQLVEKVLAQVVPRPKDKNGKNQTRNKRFLVHQQGLQGSEFRSLGPMASIRLEIKNSWCTSTGHKVQNSGLWDLWQVSD